MHDLSSSPPFVDSTSKFSWVRYVSFRFLCARTNIVLDFGAESQQKERKNLSSHLRRRELTEFIMYLLYSPNPRRGTLPQATELLGGCRNTMEFRSTSMRYDERSDVLSGDRPNIPAVRSGG